jgi:predicted DNA-binding transcriptional regulator AlpA
MYDKVRKESIGSARLSAVPPRKEPELLSIEQATREFGLSVPTLYRHMAAGRLTRHVAPAGRPRVFLDRQELVALVKPRPEKRKGRK